MKFSSAIPLVKSALTSSVIALLSLASTLASSGPREFLIQNWTREDGIPGTTVTAITQTPDGYLWLGTFAGLARFDGVRFVRIDLREEAGAPDDSITCLKTDRAGNLWIATSDGRLLKMSHGKVTVHVPPSRQTADRYVQRMAEDNSGAMWLLNYESGVNRQEGTEFQGVVGAPGALALVSGIAGNVWVAGPNQLMMSEGGALQPVWEAAAGEEFQPGALAPARAGGCWVAGSGQVRRYEGGLLHSPVTTLPGKKGAAILGFLEDREGSLWLGTYGGGVTILDPGGRLKHLTREQGLPSDLVRCLFEDREGNLWAGFEGRGLARIRRAMFASYGRVEGLSDETVLSACEGNDDEVWVGTNGDGAYRIHENRITHFGAAEGLTNQFVWSLQRDRSGKLWAGTWGGGLYRYERGQFQDTTHEFGATPVVLALYDDHENAMWLGQRTGPERIIEALAEGKRRTLAVPGELPRLEVRSIAETRDGSLWFATTEEGMLRLKDGSFQHYGAAQGLPATSISTLHVDDDGTLWLAAADAGLAYWDEKQFVTVKAARELLGQNLNQITDDGLGHLWCGTRSGVVRVKKADMKKLACGESLPLEWRRFTKVDGLPSDICSGGGFRARDGRIWFPTLTGMAVVDPRHVSPIAPSPPVLVEEAFLSGKRVHERSEAGGAMMPLKIAPGSGPLDIGYTALDFTALDRVRFRYQLLGLDETHVEAGNARVARYNHLPPGNYTFQVAARTEGGDWGEFSSGLAIVMLPYYWQTSWFQFLVVFVVLVATAAIARVVILRRVERRLAVLEQQRALESERSRISQDLHDDLGTSLMEIKFLSTVAGSPSRSPKEVKECLADINHKSLELVKALDEIVWAVNPKNDSLRNLVNYLCLFAQEFLGTASIQCRLNVPSGLPDWPLNAEQRHTLFLVTKEALANAAKHSQATEVQLSVNVAGSNLNLVIADNGRGFDSATLKTDRNGLKNIENRMRHLGGTALVRGVLNQGTRVELELPLPQASS